jgi:hypothetical protein
VCVTPIEIADKDRGIDEVLHMDRVLSHDLDQLAVLAVERRGAIAQQQLGIAANHGERRTQLA